MSENTAEEQVKDIVEEAQSPETFSLLDVLEQKETSYPERSVTVYRDGKSAGEVAELAEEIDDLKIEQATIEEQIKSSGGITGDPEAEAELERVKGEIAEREAKQVKLLEKIRSSALTFHMRGVAPALWRAIDKNWKAKIKPASKSDEDVEQAFIDRNEKVNSDVLAHSIVSITNATGAVDKSAVSIETVEKLHGSLLMSEFQKLKDMSDLLTFSNGVFQRVAEEDADFLPKP